MSGMFTVVAPARIAASTTWHREVTFGADGVFRRELDVVAIPRRSLHAGHSPLDDLLSGHPQLELAMDGAGGEEDVNPRLFGVLQRFPRSIDICVVAAGQPADGRAADVGGDLPNGLEIARGGDGEPGLDDVHAQVGQGLSDLHFLAKVHAGARRLLAVAERRVENPDQPQVRRVHSLSTS